MIYPTFWMGLGVGGVVGFFVGLWIALPPRKYITEIEPTESRSSKIEVDDV